jgi:uncharacterized membrane protein
MLTAITTYQVSVGLHAVFAVSFLGVAGANSMIGPAMRKEPQHALFGLGIVKKIYEFSVFPGIVLILITGSYQASDARWSNNPTWLTVSLALFALMVIIGCFVLYPATRIAIAELTAKGDTPGPPSDRFIAQTKKFRILGPLMGVLLIVVTFLMAAKPF